MIEKNDRGIKDVRGVSLVILLRFAGGTSVVSLAGVIIYSTNKLLAIFSEGKLFSSNCTEDN